MDAPCLIWMIPGFRSHRRLFPQRQIGQRKKGRGDFPCRRDNRDRRFETEGPPSPSTRQRSAKKSPAPPPSRLFSPCHLPLFPSSSIDKLGASSRCSRFIIGVVPHFEPAINTRHTRRRVRLPQSQRPRPEKKSGVSDRSFQAGR